MVILTVVSNLVIVVVDVTDECVFMVLLLKLVVEVDIVDLEIFVVLDVPGDAVVIVIGDVNFPVVVAFVIVSHVLFPVVVVLRVMIFVVA